jgi:uncharacterized protein YqeY
MQDNIEAQIAQDLKQAMLAKDAAKVTVLRSLKSAFTYARVAPGAGDEPLSNDTLVTLVAKEAKKRQESADAYRQAGSAERAEQELQELAIIEAYLPSKLDEAALTALVEQAVTDTGASSMADMGRVIAAAKQKAGAAADGAAIAQLVKKRLAQ